MLTVNLRLPTPQPSTAAIGEIPCFLGEGLTSAINNRGGGGVVSLLSCGNKKTTEQCVNVTPTKQIYTQWTAVSRAH